MSLIEKTFSAVENSDLNQKLTMEEIYRNKVPKIRSGEIEYCLKVDSDSKLYIKILNNSESGSFIEGEVLFQECIEIANKEPDTGNNNNSGFYRAILNQLGIKIKKEIK